MGSAKFDSLRAHNKYREAAREARPEKFWTGFLHLETIIRIGA